MTLMDAKEYDPRPHRKIVRLIVIAVVVVIVAWVAWLVFRYQPEKNTINTFFKDIEAGKFEDAYGVYNADPDWKQHPDRYSGYPYNQFLLDWGPSGDYGKITEHKIECATEPPKKGFKSPSGVIVVVRINNRGDRTESFWVEKSTKTIGYPSPQRAYCQ
jgi:hypothetical protein